ncbi:MAG TPA: hypothetical protein VFV31_10785 [Chitinophagaceae bacterium]|nr:hypothetical protein [Chitinophagaceae bacterium]
MVAGIKYFFRRWADWIVWVAGAICFLLLFYFTYYRYVDRADDGLGAAADDAGQLFLANGELGFEDKKSFVLGTLRFQWTSGQSLSSGNNRQNLYQYIYQKKVGNKTRRPAQNQDFSIRPVPK